MSNQLSSARANSIKIKSLSESSKFWRWRRRKEMVGIHSPLEARKWKKWKPRWRRSLRTVYYQKEKLKFLNPIVFFAMIIVPSLGFVNPGHGTDEDGSLRLAYDIGKNLNVGHSTTCHILIHRQGKKKEKLEREGKITVKILCSFISLCPTSSGQMSVWFSEHCGDLCLRILKGKSRTVFLAKNSHESIEFLKIKTPLIEDSNYGRVK